MIVIALDIELNQPSRKIIQIGAAAFDARSAALIDRFMVYVNPGEPISPEITRLTGITDQDVSNGLTIDEAYNSLKAFHKKHKPFRNPIVWGSGTRNDSSTIHDEYVSSLCPPMGGIAVESIPENFMGFRVIDVKSIYQSVAIFENSQYSGGLKDVMKKLGMEFEGQEHQALPDAMNTFRVWYHLMRIFHDGKVAQKKKS
jgi:inhibitor of KinA sporulation pathway (predicted exonuclease)